MRQNKEIEPEMIKELFPGDNELYRSILEMKKKQKEIEDNKIDKKSDKNSEKKSEKEDDNKSMKLDEEEINKDENKEKEEEKIVSNPIANPEKDLGYNPITKNKNTQGNNTAKNK